MTVTWGWKRVKIVTCIHIYMAIVNNYVTLLDGSPRPIYHMNLLHLSSKANSNLKIGEGAKRKEQRAQKTDPVPTVLWEWMKEATLQEGLVFGLNSSSEIFTGTANPRSWVSMQK